MIARDCLNEGDQPNVLKPNFDNASAKQVLLYTFTTLPTLYSVGLHHAGMNSVREILC